MKDSAKQLAIRAMMAEAWELRKLYREADDASDNADRIEDQALSSDSSSSSSTSSSDASSLEPVETAPYDDDDDDDDAYLRSLAFLEDAISMCEQKHVLFPNTVYKSSQLPLILKKYYKHDPKRFQQNLRVSPHAFDVLVAMIQEDSAFSNESINDQLPVPTQLAIVLYRLGHDGNSASVDQVAQWAGVSVGTIYNCTRRVFIAILRLHDRAVHWPIAEEKEEAKQWVDQTVCSSWRDGFCMVDGTLVVLAQKPGYHGEAYFSRKSSYSLNVQIVSLPNRQIIDYGLGHCGSVPNDSIAFADTRTSGEHQHLFEHGKWMWADSAYAIQPWCIVPYKKPLANLRENRVFNYWLSSVEYSEYMRLLIDIIQINNKHCHKKAVAWIRVCIILHNLIQQINRGADDAAFDEELIREALRTENHQGDHEDDLPTQAGRRQNLGQAKREYLKQLLHDSADTALEGIDLADLE